MNFTDYQNLIVEQNNSVGIITLNRPHALNALNEALMKELTSALDHLEADHSTSSIILTGSDKAFAAGADIKEIQNKNFSDVYEENFITAWWERVTRCRKPIIAAVSGYAVGGGCELALMCDIIIASDTAKFSLPETKIGVIPGAGGTQRLTKAVGKAVAMDMVLTGRIMDSTEALARGLVSRVATIDHYLADAIDIAQKISESSNPIVRIAKEAVNHSFETHLQEGVYIERRLLYSTFATQDRKEGMKAFIEKRQPNFKNC